MKIKIKCDKKELKKYYGIQSEGFDPQLQHIFFPTILFNYVTKQGKFLSYALYVLMKLISWDKLPTARMRPLCVALGIVGISLFVISQGDGALR
jgi:hypothetical protein